MAQAKADAAAQHKGIYLIFGASWCGWCRRLEQFNHAPEISALLDQNYVTVHLTVEERKGKEQLDNPGGLEMMQRMGGQGGLPFFAFLGADGKPFVTSNRPAPGESGDTNIGFPGSPEEIEWFLTMMRKALPSASDSQLKMFEVQIRRLLPAAQAQQ